MQTVSFEDPATTFDLAIEHRLFSDIPGALHYAGNYMYMYTKPETVGSGETVGKRHYFKHRDTRKYSSFVVLD